MKRYINMTGCLVGMATDINGDWVRYKDVAAHIGELESELAALKDKPQSDQTTFIELLQKRITALEAQLAEYKRERQEQIDIIMSNPVTCINRITHPVDETKYDDCIYCHIHKLEVQLAAEKALHYKDHKTILSLYEQLAAERERSKELEIAADFLSHNAAKLQAQIDADSEAGRGGVIQAGRVGVRRGQ